MAPDVGAVNRVAQETALNALAQTLGCEQDDHRRTTCVSTLADRLWVPLDLLPALVLGSTPAVSMTLSKKQSDSPKQYGPDWERETRPYRALFQGPDADGGPDDQEVKQLFEYGVRATGIMAVKIGEGPPYWVRLIGHAGKRVRLAETLRACVVPGAATEGYLTRLLACGESYNLRRVLESITGQADPLGHADSGSGAAGDRLPSPERRADGAQLPLHLEAALYLVRERLALTPGDGALAETMGETLDSAWLALARALDAPLPPPGPPPAGLWPDTATRRADAARCYCAYLGAVELLESAPVASADRPRQASLLADPGFMERLAKTLEDGEADRQQVQEQVGAMCQLELEGIAFGTLLPATQIIDALKAELEEVRVQAAGAPE
ncbi:hypothetical protein [uncultured Thiodictyon sp.]|uniref:hypothetical protein n=1 Tax=uncultured Thiodictyon sp. TaxID=1846217 RepID=UPI0025E30573|nr:hypothetical protein [uncultured Thiodictyon sp.]